MAIWFNLSLRGERNIGGFVLSERWCARWSKMRDGSSRKRAAASCQSTICRLLIAQVTFYMSMGGFYLVFALYVQQGRGLDPVGSKN